MRTLAFLEKTVLENVREWKILVLALTFAPFFVYLMYAYFSGTSPAYRLLVVNRDTAARQGGMMAIDGASGLLAAWRATAHADARPAFVITEVQNETAAAESIRNRDADLLVVIPAGFSRSLADLRDGKAPAAARLGNHSDEGNARGFMAMALSDFVAFGYVAGVTGYRSPLELDITRIGSGKALTEFDLYVPALLVLAPIMVLFTACASLIREIDRGTITRLKLSRLGVGELLAAVSVNQVLIGTGALALAYLAAVSTGYRADGSLGAVLVVGAVTTLGVVALSVIVASFLGTIYELLTVGCFPFFVLMFFSEGMMPLPKVEIARLAGHALYLNDALPTSLGVRAFGRVLNHGAGLGDVTFELTVAGALTTVYFLAGAWLFRRRHYQTR